MGLQAKQAALFRPPAGAVLKSISGEVTPPEQPLTQCEREHRQMRDLLERVTQCSHRDPNEKRVWSPTRGRWLTVSMRSDLWDEIVEILRITRNHHGTRRNTP